MYIWFFCWCTWICNDMYIYIHTYKLYIYIIYTYLHIYIYTYIYHYNDRASNAHAPGSWARSTSISWPLAARVLCGRKHGRLPSRMYWAHGTMPPETEQSLPQFVSLVDDSGSTVRVKRNLYDPL
jgi:hypothetical protein